MKRVQVSGRPHVTEAAVASVHVLKTYSVNSEHNLTFCQFLVTYEKQKRQPPSNV